MSKKNDEEKELYINGELWDPQEIVVTAFAQKVFRKATSEEIISAIMNAGCSYEPILEHDCWKCPICEETYKYDDKYNYCPYCGRRISWELEEDERN